ncbi:hypothetical protein J2125_002610 [Erwinia toletana]|uniref:Uncharacterized protein n=1 Tax=Winslowiella toletana TaxID=92490 RepID=A0ABS4P9W5_9GAMM|nr:class I SAM-dependent methyltransferase [Winslowiella toletana]MBP2169418.1 hypothetical protein [Winslowiella toletana]
MVNNKNAVTVETFYCYESGWRMFDVSRLTSAVNAYLCAEKAIIANLLQQPEAQIDEFIEVGCGYGRYLPLISAQNINYCGIDLVSWLVALGKIRLPLYQAHSAGQARIEVCSVDKVRDLLIASDQDKTKKFCIFFPFNCFGNLPYPRQVLAHLSGLNVTMIISGFLPDARTSDLRQDYYAKCGCQHLQVSPGEQGTLITSADGLNSLAYHPESLQQLLAEFGFSLSERYSSTENSEIAVFSSVSANNFPLREKWLLRGFSDADRESGLMKYHQSEATILHHDESAMAMVVRTKNSQWQEQSLVWLVSPTTQVITDNYICGRVQKTEPLLDQAGWQKLTISTSRNTHS